jgi:26S proteasome regulatory subunit N10
MLISSPICMPEDMPGGGAEAAPGGGAMAGLGIDPNMDPELAEAIRISLEESKAADSSAQA